MIGWIFVGVGLCIILFIALPLFIISFIVYMTWVADRVRDVRHWVRWWRHGRR